MRIGIWVLALALLVAPFVFAAPTSVQNVSEGTAETYTPTIVDNNTTIAAGYVKEVNISIENVTGYWAGIYGNLTQSYVLADAAGNIFYKWNVANLTGHVLLATAADVNWNGLTVPVTTADVNAAVWKASTYPPTDENVESTFATQDTTGSVCYVANAYYVNTYDNTGAAVWPTCIIKDNQGNIVFDAPIRQDQNSFNGTKVDYQALVAATSTGTTYYFYVG